MKFLFFICFISFSGFSPAFGEILWDETQVQGIIINDTRCYPYATEFTYRRMEMNGCTDLPCTLETGVTYTLDTWFHRSGSTLHFAYRAFGLWEDDFGSHNVTLFNYEDSCTCNNSPNENSGLRSRFVLDPDNGGSWGPQPPAPGQDVTVQVVIKRRWADGETMGLCREFTGIIQ